MTEDGLAGFSQKNTQYLISNGLRIAYETFGDRQQPALILVAGLYNQLVRWPVVFCEALADRGFFVVRFDNRDIGLSDKIEAARAPNLFRQYMKHRLGIPVAVPYRLEDMAHDIVGILDALKIRAAHLVGMSMGGMICQIAAGRYPHRVLSLTSMMSNTGVVSKGKSALMVSIQMLKKPAKGQSSLDHSVETLQMIGSPGYPIADSTVRAMLTAEYRRSSYPAGYWRQMAAINTSGNRVALLRSLRMPVLVIHGLQDRLVSVDGGIDTAKHVANANLQIFPGMGHNLPHELLSTFADLILDNAGAVQR